MLAIVESRADRASTHVCEHLRELADWERREDDSRPDADGGGACWRTDGAELRSFDDLHLHLERPAEAFEADPDVLVFASRHSGETGPLLSGHFTGNFGPAEYGGDDRAVAAAAPNALAALFAALERYAPEGYDVGIECTHHGPTDVGAPSLFAELGSDEPQWDDPEGARAVARAILDLRGVPAHRDPLESGALAGRRSRETRRQVLGVGGGHYAPRFERIVRETPWAVGHVASDWALEAMGDPEREAARAVLEAAVEASRAAVAVLEGDHPAVERVLEDLGIRVESETWLRAVGDRPLDLVARVESELGRVDEGVRFGEVVAEDVSVVDLPVDLVREAEGIDPGRARAAVAAGTVAFETTEGASRLGERAVVPAGAADASPDGERAAVVGDLAAVLAERYDEVRIADGAVVAEREAFDPELAREAGVPEGPEFGALADGESVTVDGERVDPEDVRVERTRRFPLPSEFR